MKTPQTMTRSSASALGMVPSATQSATALATAYWAGPNICTACFIPLIVTLVIRTVAGLTARFGVSTASRLVCPSDWVARALAKAAPTGPVFEPISRSMWAISLPSPTRASPMFMVMLLAMAFVSDPGSSVPGCASEVRPAASRRETGGTEEPNHNSPGSLRNPHPIC